MIPRRARRAAAGIAARSHSDVSVANPTLDTQRDVRNFPHQMLFFPHYATNAARPT